jgi:hypothetical protein
VATKNKNHVRLDSEIIVSVRRLSDKDQLRAAAIFNPKTLDQAIKGKPSNSDAIDLWNGNEAYLMFIVENAVTLQSPLPADDTWLKKIKRNSRAYHIDPDDLDDPDYVRSLYVRHIGMTGDIYISAVTDIAVQTGRQSTNGIKPALAVIDQGDDDDE